MAASHSSSVLPFKCAVSLELFNRAYKKCKTKVGFISAADPLNTIENSVYKLSNIKNYFV